VQKEKNPESETGGKLGDRSGRAGKRRPQIYWSW